MWCRTQTTGVLMRAPTHTQQLDTTHHTHEPLLATQPNGWIRGRRPCMPICAGERGDDMRSTQFDAARCLREGGPKVFASLRHGDGVRAPNHVAQRAEPFGSWPRGVSSTSQKGRQPVCLWCLASFCPVLVILLEPWGGGKAGKRKRVSTCLDRFRREMW